jgi:hypothetical protein
MKLELLDPKWREEKIDDINRKKNPTTAEGDEISRSLRRMVANRPDISINDASSHLNAINQRPEDQQNRVIWDGHSNSINRTTANAAMLAQQQRRNLEEAMRNRSDLFPNAPPNLPPQNFNPMQANMQLRPPSTAQLLGYQTQASQPSQINPYAPQKKNNQNNQGR